MLGPAFGAGSEEKAFDQISEGYTFILQVQGVWRLQRGLQPHPLLLLLADRGLRLSGHG